MRPAYRASFVRPDHPKVRPVLQKKVSSRGWRRAERAMSVVGPYPGSASAGQVLVVEPVLPIVERVSVAESVFVIVEWMPVIAE